MRAGDLHVRHERAGERATGIGAVRFAESRAGNSVDHNVPRHFNAIFLSGGLYPPSGGGGDEQNVDADNERRGGSMARECVDRDQLHVRYGGPAFDLDISDDWCLLANYAELYVCLRWHGPARVDDR